MIGVSLSVHLLPQDRRHHAMSLVSEAERVQRSGLSYPETETFRSLVCTFKSGLEDFLCRAEACGRELQIMVTVCDFCEQVCRRSVSSTQDQLLPCRNRHCYLVVHSIAVFNLCVTFASSLFGKNTIIWLHYICLYSAIHLNVE